MIARTNTRKEFLVLENVFWYFEKILALEKMLVPEKIGYWKTFFKAAF